MAQPMHYAQYQQASMNMMVMRQRQEQIKGQYMLRLLQFSEAMGNYPVRKEPVRSQLTNV